MYEYVGLVVLVAGVIVALPMAGFGDELVRRFRCSVAAVTLGSDKACTSQEKAAATHPVVASDGGGGTGTSSTHPAGGPADGPGFGDGDIPVLPFPGALSVTNSVGVVSDLPYNLPGEGSVIATSTTVVERSTPKLVRQEVKAPLTQRQRQLLRRGYDVNRQTYTRLRDMVTLKLSTTLVGGPRVEMEGGNLKVAQGHGHGTTRKYQVTVSQEYAEAIDNGTRPAPNPRDPRSIPKGSSILMSHSYFTRNHSEMQLSVLRNWAFGMEQTNNKGRRISSMVQRVDADEVRIVVGDASYVENIFKAGVSYSSSGPEDKNNVSLSVAASSTDTMSSGTARQIVLEIDTKKGWRAYQHFVETGQLPTWTGKRPSYVTGSSRVTTVKTTSKTSLEAEIEAEFNIELTDNFTLRGSGGASYSLPLGEGSSYAKTIQRTSDGSVKITSTRRIGDVTWTATQTTDESGKVTNTEYRMLLDDVEASWASQYSTANSGSTMNYDKKQDIALTFDGEELDSLQQQVYKHIAQRCRSTDKCSRVEDLPDQPSAQDIREMLHGKDHADFDEHWLYPGTLDNTLWSEIARADNRKEIVEALSGNTGWSNNQILAITQLARDLCEGPASDGQDHCKPAELAPYVPGDVKVVRPEG